MVLFVFTIVFTSDDVAVVDPCSAAANASAVGNVAVIDSSPFPASFELPVNAANAVVVAPADVIRS